VEALQLPLRVVFFTNGDNNQWSFLVYRKRPVVMPKAMQEMGEVRREEAIAAGRPIGVETNEMTFLGYPDFGTLTIWNQHWGDSRPFRSMLTQVSAVPYAHALRPGAPHKGEEILRDLTTVLREFRPTKIFLSHPADHNPDHRALYLFTRLALWSLEAEMKPELFPYWVHIGGWPVPKGDHPQEPLRPPALYHDDIAWRRFPLRQTEVEMKRRAVEAYRSQYVSSGGYLLSFVRANELFGDFLPVRLRQAGESAPLSPPAADAAQRTPDEELTNEERSLFVGVISKSLALEDGKLVFTIEISRPLTIGVEASIAFFGYRNDRPFGRMPKLRVKLAHVFYGVYDQARKIPSDTVRVERHLKSVTVRVPLKALGEPQRVLVSAHTHIAPTPVDFLALPLDWVGWRIVDLATRQ
jgi:LmbE family N-acetylglucosaminyl deacetylase